jgi:hypothetical protein
MRLRRVRFSVRRLMVAVAVVAVSMGGWKEYQRGMRSRKIYELRVLLFEVQEDLARSDGNRTHAQWEADCREVERLNRHVRDNLGNVTDTVLFPPDPPEVARKKVVHYARLKAKYARAARFPWWPVTPDPPTPR